MSFSPIGIIMEVDTLVAFNVLFQILYKSLNIILIQFLI